MNQSWDYGLVEEMRRIIGPASYGVDDDDLLQSYLQTAAEEILNRRFPYGWRSVSELEPRYRALQVQIAVFLFNKRGLEGESLHSENGINRSFAGHQHIPAELLQQVVPRGRVV